jgi:NADH-quinone oxidoreductase subunit L
MLIPLAVLAVGSVLAGMVWYKPFFGDHAAVNAYFGLPAHAEAAAAAPAEGAEPPAPAETHAEAAPAQEAPGEAAEVEHAAPAHGWETGAIFMAADNHVMDEAHHSPAWVKASPFVAMLLGLGIAYLFYIVDPRLPVAFARHQPVLYRFLLNKWYFDEIYEAIFVRPAKWVGTLLWKQGDLGAIDGTINGVAMGLVPYVTRLAGRAQSGYLFHYAFAMVLGLVLLTLWLGLRAGG